MNTTRKHGWILLPILFVVIAGVTLLAVHGMAKYGY